MRSLSGRMGAAALANRCPVCDAPPGVGCVTAPYSLGARRPLRKPHRARAGVGGPPARGKMLDVAPLERVCRAPKPG